MARDVASLVREAGQKAKLAAIQKAASDEDNAIGASASKGPRKPRIFNILEYIEAPWGLQLSLYPAQRFLVKLYYNLPLEEKVKTIRVSDMFNTRTLYDLTEREYLSYLYSEGRCNIKEQDHERRELLLAIGRRSGKCVAGDTLVATGQGLRRIRTLGAASKENFAPASIEVAQEAGKRASAAAFYNGGVKPTYTVRTASGYEITGTGNHRIKVMSPAGRVEWQYLDEIQSGDFVALNRTTDLWASEAVNLHAVVEGDRSLPDSLDEHVGYHMGLVVGGADASADVNVVRIGAALGWDESVAPHERRLPWAILQSPKNVVCAFLRGLWESAGLSGGETVVLSGLRLAQDLQVLLLNLGVVTNVQSRGVAGVVRAQVTLEGQRSQDRFASSVGLPVVGLERTLTSHIDEIPHQRQRVRDWLESAESETREPSSGSERLRSTLGWGRWTFAPLTYQRLRNALGVAKETAVGAEETKHFEDLLRLDYAYDPVVSVTQGSCQVYDLTVPDGQSFVANGLTNHNTTLSGIFASYELYRLLNLHNPQEYYGLPNGNRIQIISVGTDKEQAGLLFNEVTSHLTKCDYFNPYVANNTLSHIQFRTPYDIERYGPNVRHKNGKFVSLNGKATLRVTFKSCNAKGLRGSGNIVIILDELAHYLEQGGSSAKEIYDSVTPSAAAFSPKDPSNTASPIGPVESRIISISSPLNKSGKFYDLYALAMSGGAGSENMLAIQAPTWEINPTLPASYYKQKYHADPAVFMTEHGAQFSDRVRGWIERAEDLKACVRPDLRPIKRGVVRAPYQMGIDLGLVGDGTAIFITHVDDSKIIMDYHEVWQAGKDWRESNPHLDGDFTTDYCRNLSNVARLDFDEIADWIELLTKRFYITAGLFDRWNGIPLEQALVKKGLSQFKSEYFTRDLTSKMYQSIKMLIFDRAIQVYDWPRTPDAEEAIKKHSPFIQELLKLQAEQVARNTIVVQAPSTPGAHDDMSDAFVRSAWLSMNMLTRGDHQGLRGGDNVAATPGGLAGYHMRRARAHGGFSERTVPSSLGIRTRRGR